MDTMLILKRKKRILHKGILNLLLLLVWWGIPQAAGAQPVPSPLQSLIKEGLANNPGIQAMQAEWEAAKLRVPQASALPDPTVGYTVMGPMLETRTGPQEDMYEFEQMIPFPGKLAEKRKIARAEAQAAEARLNKAQRELILKISETYYELYAVEENLETLNEVHELLLNFERTAQAFYASMKGTQKDINKAQIEATEVLQRKLELHQQKQSLWEMLNALVNRPIKEEELYPLPVFSVPDNHLNLDKLITQAQKNRPELKEADSTVKAAEHASRLSKYEYAPDISVGFQYFGIGSGMTSDPDDGQDAWMIPIKFTIPLWQNRIVPAVKEAKENLQASQARLKDIENLSLYEVKNTFFQFSTAREVVDLYEKVLLPQAQLALRSETAAYEAGGIDLLNLIETQRIYLNATIAYHQALADTLKKFAMLERIVGIDLTAQGGIQ